MCFTTSTSGLRLFNFGLHFIMLLSLLWVSYHWVSYISIPALSLTIDGSCLQTRSRIIFKGSWLYHIWYLTSFYMYVSVDFSAQK
jgi:hypothetical protein